MGVGVQGSGVPSPSPGGVPPAAAERVGSGMRGGGGVAGHGPGRPPSESPGRAYQPKPRPEFASLREKLRVMAREGRLVRALLGGGAACFRSPVRWLLGRDLLAQASSILLYSAFANELDHRDWMYPEVVDLSRDPDAAATQEFWFDYIADAGDGQLAMYSVAYLALGDLWLGDDSRAGSPRVFTHAEDAGTTTPTRLPRGRFLFVGGDTAYHVGDHPTLDERFASPFGWAYADRRLDDGIGIGNGSVNEPKRFLFAIPGNHDYYDSLAGFNRQFRATCSDKPPLVIADFVRTQQASFTALKLPFDWLFYGLDSQEGKLSFRQTRFFQDVLGTSGDARRLIVASPEPSTVFGSIDERSTRPFAELQLPRPFVAPTEAVPTGSIHLDLAGDVHHYARYFGPSAECPNYASVVAGGGGAFLHPTQTDVARDRRVQPSGSQPVFPPSPAPEAIYPEPEASRLAVSPALLLPWRIADGGFVWLVGALLAFIAAFALLVAPGTRFLHQPIHHLVALVGQLGGSAGPSLAGTFPRTIASGGLSYIAANVLRPRNGQALGSPCLPDGLELIFVAAVTSLFVLFGVITARLMRRARMPDTIVPTRSFIKPLGLLLLAVVVGIVGYAVRPPPLPDKIHPLRASVLVLLYASVLVVGIIWSVRYAAVLARQARRRSVSGKDYVPVWAVLSLGIGSAAFGVFRHGGHSVGEMVSDMLALVVLVGLLVGLPLAGAFAGAGRLRARGKIAVGLLGLWLGVLILLGPVLLAAYAGPGNVVAMGAVLAVGHFIGWKFLSRRKAAWPLVVAWVVVGVAVLVAAAWAPVAHPPSWWRLGLAALAGAVLSCVWFGWYLASALALDAHNNEAGGAARVQDYKHILRVRLRKDELTGFVIGIPTPATHGRQLEPILVDTFTLRPS